MIVEDRSVNLDQSILQNEILSAAPSKYLHLRMYQDCIDVVHDNIYDHGKVRDVVVDCITRCGDAATGASSLPSTNAS